MLNNSITGVIKKRNRVVSPTGKLPEHILAMIFEVAVDTTWSRDQFYKTPLALSSVCARWRDVALETRMIWRYVTLDIGIWRDISTHYGPGTFLKKADGAPIFLTVRSDKRLELLDMQYRIVELIDEIAPFSGSVVSLDVSFMHPEYMSTFVQSWLDQCTSVSLRNLSLANQCEPINVGLWTAKSTAGDIEINSIAFVELLSQIRSLSISNAAIPRSRNAFHNLLELRIANTLVRHRPSIRKVARVLACCSNIHTLELRHFAPTRFRDEQGRAVSPSQTQILIHWRYKF
ncbi:alpha-L-fucosidase [Ceratobasidium sp. AG-Ba]|nr:alpha-L-fucosidase [Ceratobasidium sp. AG-Ba]